MRMYFKEAKGLFCCRLDELLTGQGALGGVDPDLDTRSGSVVGRGLIYEKAAQKVGADLNRGLPKGHDQLCGTSQRADLLLCSAAADRVSPQSAAFRRPLG